MRSDSMHVNDFDIYVVGIQIGRKPRGVRGIAYRCPLNFPQVVISEPVVHGKNQQMEFFPTTYWLSCPHLRKKVYELESRGLTARLEKTISLDADLKEVLTDAHASYIQKRFHLLGRDIYFELDNVDHPWLQRFLRVGIAGIEDFRHLKCLHAHVAHQLAEHNNPIGEMTFRLINKPCCQSDSPRCQELIDQDKDEPEKK